MWLRNPVHTRRPLHTRREPLVRKWAPSSVLRRHSCVPGWEVETGNECYTGERGGTTRCINTAWPQAPLSNGWVTQALHFIPQNMNYNSQSCWMTGRAGSAHAHAHTCTLIQKESNGRFIVFKGSWAHDHKRPTSSLFRKWAVATQLISLGKIKRKKKKKRKSQNSFFLKIKYQQGSDPLPKNASHKVTRIRTEKVMCLLIAKFGFWD